MFKVNLYRRQGTSMLLLGSVEFDKILVISRDVYRCDPAGILTHEQVIELSHSLCHLPAIRTGTIGEYRWFESGSDCEYHPELFCF